MAEEKGKKTTQRINVPYSPSYGRITTALEKIKTASTPDRFTTDFLSTKLGLKGGSAAPIIPFLKRTGFLNSDGSPTDIYKQFRNEQLRGNAAAKALKIGYSALYEINEYAHDLTNKDLKGVIVQATGLDADSKTVPFILGSFNALKAYADFEAPEEAAGEDKAPPPNDSDTQKRKKISGSEIKLGYTINLNLPATADVAVFNAIFKSLKEHLLEN